LYRGAGGGEERGKKGRKVGTEEDGKKRKEEGSWEGAKLQRSLCTFAVV